MKRVRVGAPYWFQPIGWDKVRPTSSDVREGDFVRVVQLRGCPPAGIMGHCYVRNYEGDIALVLKASLQPLPDAYSRRHCWKLKDASESGTGTDVQCRREIGHVE